MSPALVARIELSLRGGRARSARRSPWKVALLRFGGAALLLGLVAWGVIGYRHHESQIDGERANLLTAVRAQTGDIDDADRLTVKRIDQWIAAHIEDSNDVVAPDVRDATAFSKQLAEPTIYLRGPAEDFKKEGGLRAVAVESRLDAFVLCLIDPPTTRSERTLRQKARASRAGAALATKAPSIEALSTVFVASAFLAPEWETQVSDARSLADLGRLRHDFERAHVAAAKRAMKARKLLVVVDEKKKGNGPTELDGACPHDIRVAWIDLKSDRVLLRAKKFVDPGWLSDDARAVDAVGVNDCDLALGVRAQMGF